MKYVVTVLVSPGTKVNALGAPVEVIPGIVEEAPGAISVNGAMTKQRLHSPKTGATVET